MKGCLWPTDCGFYLAKADLLYHLWKLKALNVSFIEHVVSLLTLSWSIGKAVTFAAKHRLRQLYSKNINWFQFCNLCFGLAWMLFQCNQSFKKENSRSPKTSRTSRRNELQPILFPKGVAMLVSKIPPPIWQYIIKMLDQGVSFKKYLRPILGLLAHLM